MFRWSFHLFQSLTLPISEIYDMSISEVMCVLASIGFHDMYNYVLWFALWNVLACIAMVCIVVCIGMYCFWYVLQVLVCIGMY